MPLKLPKIAALLVLFLSLISIGRTAAQTCGVEYVLKQGESLTDIARTVYGTPSEWTTIFYANQDRLGVNASLLVPGSSIRLPCRGNNKPAQPSTPAQTTDAAPGRFELSVLLKRVEFLTADNFSPFTDRSLPEGGLTTNIVSAAMTLIKEEAPGKFDFNIGWVNDWSAHLNPLLSSKAFDAGFPWSKPDCDRVDDLDANGKLRCGKFLFSDPLYENVTPAFVQKDSPIAFNTDDEILGKNVCRPKGHFTYLFDKAGRRWLKDKKITLMQPPTVEECFRLLDSGSADVVVVSDFVGRAAIASLGMRSKVKILQRPLSIDTFHVIVAKTHPQALSVLYYVNSALARLRANGDFDRIVDKQLQAFWDAQDAKPVSPPRP